MINDKKANNMLFCVLRNKNNKNSKSIDQVNIPLYMFQKKLKAGTDSKAFVYRSENGIVIYDFGELPVDDIYYADTRCESGNYADCLMASYAVMVDHCEKHPLDNNFLFILMEQNVSYTDVFTFLNMYQDFMKNRSKMKFSVILIYNDSSNIALEPQLKAFIEDDNHYISGCKGLVCSFSEFSDIGGGTL